MVSVACPSKITKQHAFKILGDRFLLCLALYEAQCDEWFFFSSSVNTDSRSRNLRSGNPRYGWVLKVKPIGKPIADLASISSNLERDVLNSP